MAYTYKIREVVNEVVIVDVLKGTEVLFTKKFKSDLDLDLNKIKRVILNDIENFENEQKDKDELKIKMNKLEKEIDKEHTIS